MGVWGNDVDGGNDVDKDDRTPNQRHIPHALPHSRTPVISRTLPRHSREGGNLGRGAAAGMNRTEPIRKYC